MSPEEIAELQKQQCIFCQIISGKIPSKKIYEDDDCLAILDINPATKGHLLLLPKEHYVIMPQVPEKLISHLFIIAKNLSTILLKGLKVGGTNFFIANGLVAGQKAQHFMIHLIPRKEDDKIFDIPEKLVNQEILGMTKEAVQIKIDALLGVQRKVVKDKKVEDESLEESDNDIEDKEPITKKKTKKTKKKPKKETEPVVDDDDDDEDTTNDEDTSEVSNNEDDEDNFSLDDIAELFI